MGVEDIRGKLQKIAKLEILRALAFGSIRLWIEKIHIQRILSLLVNKTQTTLTANFVIWESGSNMCMNFI